MICRCSTPLCPTAPGAMLARDPGRPVQKRGIHDETYCACRRGCRARRDRRCRPERSDRRPQGADEGERQSEPHRPRDDRRQAAVRPRQGRKRCWRTSRTRHDKGKSLWPDNSKAGDTASLPAVWENKADFDAKLAKFSADAKAQDAKREGPRQLQGGDGRGRQELRRLPQHLSQESVVTADCQSGGSRRRK